MQEKNDKAKEKKEGLQEHAENNLGFNFFDQEEEKKDLAEQQSKTEQQLKDLLSRGFVKDINREFHTKSKEVSMHDIIRKLSASYKNEKLVFVLGAGVSMSYGVPGWDMLLQKLMVNTIEKEQSASNALSKLFNELFSPSPLIAGRFIQKYFESKNSSFEEIVRKVLYAEINQPAASHLMDEIVKFCVAAGKSPNLDSIITYNFDDLVEQHLLKTNIEVPFRPIYGLGMNPEPGELPIYHVHGFLPEKGELSGLNQITFGENVYHKHYSDIYSWNNIVQINKFRDCTCLFIGSSLTDPNTRRLLDIARIQKGDREETHFLIKRKYQTDEIRYKLKNLLDENNVILEEKSKALLNFDDTVKFLIETIETFEDNDASSFGVKTIWIDDYAEIPEILRQIRSRKNK